MYGFECEMMLNNTHIYLDKDIIMNEKMATNSSKVELLENLKELLKSAQVQKTEVDDLKQLFYKQQKAEQAQLLQQFLAAGGNETEFSQQEDAIDVEFKNLLDEFKTKRYELNELSKQEKESNFLSKKNLILQLEKMVDDLDNVENINQSILAVRKIQQEWKNIGSVAPEKSKDLFRNYQLNIEKFYDFIKINNEFRDYDLKKNLEIKTALCEQAEKLSSVEDILSAFRELQALHNEWKETGPVAKELREEIWERFKQASAIVNKKHQVFFDQKKEEEELHLQQKNLICEELEKIDFSELTTFKAWEDKTKEIIDIQSKWKKIGFAPKKMNVKVYDRFRKACDSFFHQKNEFFLKAKTELVLNLDKKTNLCEQAEAMKDNTDWKQTADKYIKLQKEWKNTGPVPRKNSEAIWKRFIAACDYFFEQRDKAGTDEKSIQRQNLLMKKEIVSKIESLDVEVANALEILQGYISEYNQIGFVPFKDKDKILKQFNQVVNDKFDKLGLDEHQKSMNLFKSNIEQGHERSTNQLFREREKLLKELEHLKSEISVYENNIGFFSASKKADSIIKDLHKKIEGFKEEQNLILEKIQLLEEKL